VSIDIDDCCIPESGHLSVTATIIWATAKSLAEGQTVLDRHHVIKHRVYCAGEEVETSCNILTKFCNSGFLEQYFFLVTVWILQKEMKCSSETIFTDFLLLVIEKQKTQY
jgi:hypothetical protein